MRNLSILLSTSIYVWYCLLLKRGLRYWCGFDLNINFNSIFIILLRLRAAYSSSSKVTIYNVADVANATKHAEATQLDAELVAMDPLERREKEQLQNLITIETEVCFSNWNDSSVVPAGVLLD